MFALLAYCFACSLFSYSSTRKVQITGSHLMIYYRYFREDLYGLDHVTGWEPYDLYDLANVSIGSDLDALYRHILHNISSQQIQDRYHHLVHDLGTDRDLSEVWTVFTLIFFVLTLVVRFDAL